jgi:hypothetical protein
MDNGCPKCKKLAEDHVIGEYFELCLDCQLEQADADLSRDMKLVEKIKKKIKEKEDARCDKSNH